MEVVPPVDEAIARLAIPMSLSADARRPTDRPDWRLLAVVHSRPPSPAPTSIEGSAGHYTALVRSPEDGEDGAAVWHRDDGRPVRERIEPASLDAILASDGSDRRPYLLVFGQVEADEMEVDRDAMDADMALAALQPDDDPMDASDEEGGRSRPAAAMAIDVPTIGPHGAALAPLPAAAFPNRPGRRADSIPDDTMDASDAAMALDLQADEYAWPPAAASLLAGASSVELEGLPTIACMDAAAADTAAVRPRAGLPNLGASCYMSAVLQLFFPVDDFVFAHADAGLVFAYNVLRLQWKLFRGRKWRPS
jgi:hypothetical protein